MTLETQRCDLAYRILKPLRIPFGLDLFPERSSKILNAPGGSTIHCLVGGLWQILFAFSPIGLRTRISTWSEEAARLGNLPPKSESVLEAVLYCDLPRVVSSLIAKGMLTSESSRAPLRLAFIHWQGGECRGCFRKDGISRPGVIFFAFRGLCEVFKLRI